MNDYMKEKFAPTILHDGCAAYYNRSLYPLYNKFERQLRKLLYLKAKMSGNKEDAAVTDNIENMDLGGIFELLFTDSVFVENFKKTTNSKSWKFTKQEILSELQELNENTLWDRTIGEDVAPLLRTEFNCVRRYRNDIMHAHSMSKDTFRRAKKLIEQINRQLEEAIEDIAKEHTTEQTGKVSNFSTALLRAIENAASMQTVADIYADSISSAMKGFWNCEAVIEKYVNAYKNTKMDETLKTAILQGITGSTAIMGAGAAAAAAVKAIGESSMPSIITAMNMTDYGSLLEKVQQHEDQQTLESELHKEE